MKKTIAFIFLITLFSITHSEDGKWILQKIDEFSDFQSVYSKSKMTIIKKGKITSTMEFEAYSKKVNNDDYMLAKYYYPKRLKGTAILSKDNSIWYYNKRSNRIRLLSKSAKKGSMMGSSFSYDDMEMNYLDDFTSEILNKRSKNYLLKLIPRDKDSKYKYLKMSVDKKSFLVKSIEYYDDNNIKFKTLNIIKYKQFDNKWYETELEMIDEVNGKLTRIKTYEDSIKTEIDIPDSQFSERKLKK